jgi:hypothetical protein
MKRYFFAAISSLLLVVAVFALLSAYPRRPASAAGMVVSGDLADGQDITTLGFKHDDPNLPHGRYTTDIRPKNIGGPGKLVIEGYTRVLDGEYDDETLQVGVVVDDAYGNRVVYDAFEPFVVPGGERHVPGKKFVFSKTYNLPTGDYKVWVGSGPPGATDAANGHPDDPFFFSEMGCNMIVR